MNTLVKWLCAGMAVLVLSTDALGWAAKAHDGLTKKVLSQSECTLDDYLKDVLGIEEGIDKSIAIKVLYSLTDNDLNQRKFEDYLGDHLGTNAIRKYIIAGALMEDETLVGARSRHHFHDPKLNSGLENRPDNLGFHSGAGLGAGGNFDYDGDSARAWALQTKSKTSGYDPQKNWFSFFYLRDYQHLSLTASSNDDREDNLARMFLALGHVMHLLEDMGVPAHVRNDFLFAHLRTSGDVGDAFETWVDNQIGGGGLPAAWFSGWSCQPAAISKVSDFWDADKYHGTSGPQDNSWGLSEQTNYQFLSWSSMFRTNTQYYNFTHPKESNLSFDLVGPRGYYNGYNVYPMMQQTVFDTYVTDPARRYMVNTPVGVQMFDAYAKITLPRTVDYVTGLVNYIFRGRLEARIQTYTEDLIELKIRNLSYHTDTNHPYALKGGEFNLYWEDYQGVRQRVNGFDYSWGMTSILKYYDENDDNTIYASFRPVANATKYILLYEGEINPNDKANQPDPDDKRAVASAVFYPPYPFVCVACSARGTLVRINARTGQIVGEYRTAPSGRGTNPSRTTVDIFGNVWCGNRGESAGGKGSVVKMGFVIGGTRCNADGTANPSGDYLKPPFSQCTAVDRNGDGLIKTSRGLGDIRSWSNAGGADNNGGVSTADDECILMYVRTFPAAVVRHVSIDKSNNVWVGGYDDHKFELIEGSSGRSLRTFNVGKGGYGGLIDRNGVLWSSPDVLRYDTRTGQNKTCGSAYGLTIDTNGCVWSASGSNICKFRPNGNIVSGFPKSITALGSGSGLAVSPKDNHVWVADPGNNKVHRFSNSGKLIKSIPVGTYPKGVAVDIDGKVWVVCSEEAKRIDPAVSNGTVDMTVGLGAGAGAYNYSDMTGIMAHYIFN